MKTYDNKIFVRRKKLGYSRKELSALAGISFETIKAIETGRTEIDAIKVGTLRKIAKALDCDIKKLL